ncbi:hypothetical protein FKM82_009777 [Ascaphus truei]
MYFLNESLPALLIWQQPLLLQKPLELTLLQINSEPAVHCVLSTNISSSGPSIGISKSPSLPYVSPLFCSYIIYYRYCKY